MRCLNAAPRLDLDVVNIETIRVSRLDLDIANIESYSYDALPKRPRLDLDVVNVWNDESYALPNRRASVRSRHRE